MTGTPMTADTFTIEVRLADLHRDTPLRHHQPTDRTVFWRSVWADIRHGLWLASVGAAALITAAAL